MGNLLVVLEAVMEEIHSTLIRNALLLDLETSMRRTILKAGAVLGDTTFAASGGSSTADILSGLFTLAAGAKSRRPP